MSDVLETAARAVATANGYHFSGDSILDNAENNPCSAHFVAVAYAVLSSVQTKIASEVVSAAGGKAIAGEELHRLVSEKVGSHGVS